MAGLRDPLSDALEHLVARFSRLVQQAGRQRGLSGAALDELCQDVRIRLWKALPGGEEMGTVRAAYVYRTALSAALDMVRRRRARREEQWVSWSDAASGRRAPAGAGSGFECALEDEELAARVEQLVDALPAPRDIVVRLHLAGYGRSEIAELLGWTDGKVRNLLHRGLADLRVRLRAVGIGPAGPA